MPKLIFSTEEIESQGEGKINRSGNIYVHRKHAGRKVRWILVKEK